MPGRRDEHQRTGQRELANVRFEAAEPNGWMCKRDMFERHAAAMLAHLEVIHEH
jgi:hypothetical protein